MRTKDDVEERGNTTTDDDGAFTAGSEGVSSVISAVAGEAVTAPPSAVLMMECVVLLNGRAGGAKDIGAVVLAFVKVGVEMGVFASPMQ